MADVSQLSILLILLMEVTVLTWVEYRAWKTFYTPLCTLMLPYTFVLLVTTAIAGNFGYVPFNYDSIWVWIYGLPLFALPSYAFAAVISRKEEGGTRNENSYASGNSLQGNLLPPSSFLFPRTLLFICGIVILLLFTKLYTTLSGSLFLFGTDEFADDFSGHGIWAHIRTLLIPLIILMFYQVGKGCRWLWIPIILMLILQFVNMVKGTIVIPIFAALLMRLYTGKTRMSLRLILIMTGLGVLVFFLIYIVIPIMGNGSAADMKLVQFVGEHIVHYFTSGTMGWSFDIDQNMPDRKDFEYIVAPFVNIVRAIKGEELVSVVNRFYWCTGTDVTTLTNVRTFFGTLYIYSDAWQFITYTLFLSTFIYAWKVATIFKHSVYLDIILFYYCGLLMMGWFEFYFFHLDTIEIPLITLFYGWLVHQTAGIRPPLAPPTQEGKQVVEAPPTQEGKERKEVALG
jgi:hypothetical protein